MRILNKILISDEVFKYLILLLRSNSKLCPVMGRIAIGKEKVQFSCKLEADPKLWNTQAGRMNGKSANASFVQYIGRKQKISFNALM